MKPLNTSVVDINSALNNPVVSKHKKAPRAQSFLAVQPVQQVSEPIDFVDIKTVPQSSSFLLNGEFLVRALDATQRHLEKKSPRHMETLLENACAPAVKRPFVFVGRQFDEHIEYVKTYTTLRTLFSEIAEIVPVETYNGHDATHVEVFNCFLPETYVARVPYVKVRHLPPNMFFLKQIKLIELARYKPTIGDIKDNDRDFELVCDELYPHWTDKCLGEVSDETMYANYHRITVKICSETGRFLKWIPGLDRRSTMCANFMDQLVLLGKSTYNPVKQAVQSTQPRR